MLTNFNFWIQKMVMKVCGNPVSKQSINVMNFGIWEITSFHMRMQAKFQKELLHLLWIWVKVKLELIVEVVESAGLPRVPTGYSRVWVFSHQTQLSMLVRRVRCLREILQETNNMVAQLCSSQDSSHTIRILSRLKWQTTSWGLDNRWIRQEENPQAEESLKSMISLDNNSKLTNLDQEQSAITTPRRLMLHTRVGPKSKITLQTALVGKTLEVK